MNDDGPRLVLAIETSCDETAAAVVERGRIVRSNVIASQNELHAEYRGVVPEIASRAHAERILPIIREAIADAGVKLEDMNAIAVGNRPGLIGSLLVGVAAAKALAWTLDIPTAGVDHVQSHLIAGLIGPADAQLPEPAWPAMGLVVSGGHTSLYLCSSTTHAVRIGATIDDAVGEAYDKVAAILGLDFPGGPNLDKLAQTGVGRDEHHGGFRIARLNPESLDFSFSGLKTAARYAFHGVPETERTRALRESKGRPATVHEKLSARDTAATFQLAAIGAVMLKLERALDKHPECRTLLVGGGVSANSLLRTRLSTLASKRRIDLRLPRMSYCLDNAAMIGALGHDLLRHRGGKGDELSMTAIPTTAF